MNRFSSLTTEDLLTCYRQWDQMQHHTGVCKEGLLRNIIDEYDADDHDGRVPVRAASEDLLEEIARRWASQQAVEPLTPERRVELYSLWRDEVDNEGERHSEWRGNLNSEESIWVNRLDELDSYFWNETNDPESEEWREDLTPEEEALVQLWDDRFFDGYSKLVQDIIELSKQQ